MLQPLPGIYTFFLYSVSLAEIAVFGFLRINLKLEISQLTLIISNVSGLNTKRCCSSSASLIGGKAVSDFLSSLLHRKCATDVERCIKRTSGSIFDAFPCSLYGSEIVSYLL